MSIEVRLDKPTEPLVGEVLASRYLIESKIGEGAMGAVYRAKHVKVGRPFAVKVLHPRLLDDRKLLQRFEREAELAGRLRHPNVIGVVDVGETPGGMRYMVMEFAAGPDLATLLNEAPFTPQRITTITRQLLEGLYHAHEAGLIHRDFKPENVIIEKDTHGHDVPRIVDFGIAILREGGDSTDGPGRLTTNGLVLGTPHYMAPEQAIADPIDHRIDLFALGIIIYEMLAGKLPFDGNGAEVARANLLLDPPPISERVPYLAVDPLLEAFARRLMAKKRDHRPANAKVARDLLNLIESDREKAAAALGVPLETVRAPIVTQDAAPVRPHSGNDTFPPPLRGNAPPVTSAKAVPARDEAAYLTTTAQTELKKSRAPLIAAALASLGVLGGAAFILLNRDSEPKPGDKRDDTVAVAPTAVEPTPPAPTPSEPAPAPPQEAKPVEVEPPVEPKVQPPAEAKGEPKAPAKSTKITKPSQSAQKPTSSASSSSPPTKTQTTNVQPAAAKALDGNALAKQYQVVGGQLKALREAKGADAVSDLWSRYRNINIVDAMKTQDTRDATAAILSKLATDVAARKK
jgi:serine/threonine-protein kinase